MSENKPREFWIKPAYKPEDDDRIYFCKVPRKEYEHVIEHSAYLAEKEKVRELVDWIDDLLQSSVFEGEPIENEMYELIKKYEDKND